MLRVPGLFLAFFFLATSAQAAPMWFVFTGTLSDVRPSGLVSMGLAVGDPFTGYLLYDLVAPLQPLTPGAGSRVAQLIIPDGAHLEYEIQVDSFEFGERGDAGSVRATTAQRFEFYLLRPYAPQPPEPMLWEETGLTLNFSSPLPTWEIDASLFASGNVWFSGFNILPGHNIGNITYQVTGQITSFQSVSGPPPAAVPEPSSFLLLGVGAALMTYSVRRANSGSTRAARRAGR